MISSDKSRRRLVVLAASAGCLWPVIASADAELSRAIDAVFADVGANEPGCAAGVIHNGEYIHKAGYGLANLEYDIPITAATIFRTGSVGKQFTAMAIAILAERGDLDLDADVHEYLPDLMDYGHEVTIRQMIHHMSGMGDYDHEAFRKADGSEFRFGNEDYATIDEFYDMVARAGLVHEPGTRYQYSNLAYFLLAHVVESVSGRTLRQFAAAEIFGPLGMDHTRFNDNVNQIVKNRADGYRRMDDGSWEIFMTNLSWVGDGGVYTSLDDFIRWDQNFYHNKLGEGKPSLIDLVQTPYPDAVEYTDDGPRPVSYGFGLSIEEKNGEYMVGHTGSWVAFTAFYNRYPDLNLSAVVFCNSLEVSAPERGDRIGALAVAAVKGM
jgi:CubicO group peptidase (beta-lactamase class C family)